ncbi:MAG: DNA polymerase III subunit beta [Trueperaceae bacterium]|nr:DNA polymerase III subunit beta [Trueperaceae bacterium]
MRVHLPKKHLAETLAQVERIIPHRSSNPGLSLLNLELKDDTLIFRGSNLDLDIEATLKADVEGEGQLAIPAQVFGQVVRALPGELVELALVDQELEIRSGSFDTRLQLSDPSSVPSLHFPDSYSGVLNGKLLGDALEHVRYASAVAEYQQIFRGVKLELSDRKLRAIATDGFRLAYYHVDETSGLEGDLVIPARSVDEMVRLLGNGEARLELSEAQVSIASGIYKLNVKLMEGTFPDYERVIPAQFLVTLSLDAKTFAETVARVAVMADKTANNRIDLFVKDGHLEITAEGAYGRSQEGLEVQQEGSESQIALAYNAKYLTDALQHIDGRMRLSLSGTTSPSLLAGLDQPSYLAMVVPLRTG